MKTIASMLFLIASVVGAGLLLTSAAALFSDQYTPRRFVNLSSPALWTSGPVPVDPATQNYERLPPVYSTYVSDAPKAAPAKSNVVAADPIDAAEPKRMSEAHLAWCTNKYRSFDASTNQYRAYDGQLRGCSSPDQVTMATSDVPRAQPLGGQVAWCTARYRSYRAEDNTYQPYDGGPRRTCSQPNDVADAGVVP